MVHCAWRHHSPPEAGRVDKIYQRPGAPVPHLVAAPAALRPGDPEAQHPGKQPCCELLTLLPECHGMYPADSVLHRHWPHSPAWPVPERIGRDQLKCQPVRILEGKHLLTEALDGAFVSHAVPDEPFHPVAKRGLWDGQGDGGHLSSASAPLRRTWPREEGQDSARPAQVVAIVQVVAPRVVEVDRPLDEPQAEHARVEVHVAVGISRDRRDVMHAWYLHVYPLVFDARPSPAYSPGSRAPSSRRRRRASRPPRSARSRSIRSPYG